MDRLAPGRWDDAGTPADESDDFWVDGDYNLHPGSPCIDSADGDAAPQFDIDGNPRRDDIGMPNVGKGAPPHADMGAYEFQGTTPPVAPFAGGCVHGAHGASALAFCLLIPYLALRRPAAVDRRRAGAV